jgi:hypothetical protein
MQIATTMTKLLKTITNGYVCVADSAASSDRPDPSFGHFMGNGMGGVVVGSL